MSRVEGGLRCVRARGPPLPDANTGSFAGQYRVQRDLHPSDDCPGCSGRYPEVRRDGRKRSNDRRCAHRPFFEPKMTPIDLQKGDVSCANGYNFRKPPPIATIPISADASESGLPSHMFSSFVYVDVRPENGKK